MGRIVLREPKAEKYEESFAEPDTIVAHVKYVSLDAYYKDLESSSEGDKMQQEIINSYRKSTAKWMSWEHWL